MAAGSRPGGLTALAVINFVLSGMALLGLLGAALFLFMVARESAGTDFSLSDAPKINQIYFRLFLNFVTAALLLASGIGYIKLSLVWGRVLGNVYAAASVGGTIFDLMVLEAPFTMMAVIALVYPVMTALLLNTVFRCDFEV